MYNNPMNLPADASNDQSNCPQGYYRRNNGMLHQTPVETIVESPANAITVGLTDDELRTMSREKLSALLQSIDYRTAPSLLLSVVRETMDRIDGKATQRIEQKVEHSAKGRPSEMTTEQIMAILSQASISGLLPAGVAMSGDKLVTDADYTVVNDTH